MIVIVHDMPRQAANTLFTLSTAYQLDVTSQDYEVVVVENRTDNMLGEAAVTSLGSNFRYLEFENSTQSPAASLAYGIANTQTPNLAIMIDGARCITPRVIKYGLAAFRVDPHAMVTVPGYHLGSDEQHLATEYGEEQDIALLDSVDWRRDGYLLFMISVLFKGRHQPGYLRAMLESNCLFCSRLDYDEIGGVDLRFDLPGGGMVNLDLYRRIGDLPQTRLFVMPGEGTFHQFHGGVTTKVDKDREALMTAFKDQYLELRGEPYRSVEQRPTLIGAVTGWALPTLRESAAAEIAESSVS